MKRLFVVSLLLGILGVIFLQPPWHWFLIPIGLVAGFSMEKLWERRKKTEEQ